MNILKQILAREVKPALGCTEPIAVALACSYAQKVTSGKPINIKVKVDQGTLKNGIGVKIPYSNGERGIDIAAALGAVAGKPSAGLEVLKNTKQIDLKKAHQLIKKNKINITCAKNKKDLYIEAIITTNLGRGHAIIKDKHTNLVLLEKNNQKIKIPPPWKKQPTQDYTEILSRMKITDFIKAVKKMDKTDFAYIKKGIKMNLKMVKEGYQIKKVGYHLKRLKQKKLIPKSLFTDIEILTASAVDGRMGGISLPVMSSGGSGNQGIIAILVPYKVGEYFKIPEKKILESIALSHILNAYVKCFSGELSPICGCAIGAGVGATAAIVYQQSNHIKKIHLAINNLLAGIAGLICDGAKGSCAIKVSSSTNAILKSAFLSLDNFGTTPKGFINKNAEETIKNLGQITEKGMAKVDDIIVKIIQKK